MIKSVRLVNFFSFKDSTIHFDSDYNLLIGINGSGKSNLMKAFQLLKEGMKGRLRALINEQWGGIDQVVFKNDFQEENSIQLIFIFDPQSIGPFSHFISIEKNFEIHYEIKLHPRKSINFDISEVLFLKGSETDNTIYLKRTEGYARAISEEPESEINFEVSEELALSFVLDKKFRTIYNLRNFIEKSTVYNYFDTLPGSQIRKPIWPTGSPKLLDKGINLAQTLNTIKANHFNSFNKIISALKDVNPNIVEIDYIFIGGNIEMRFFEKGLESPVSVTQISDGTLKYLCLLSILLNPDRGKFISIDEPETGLHPDMLFNLANLIKEASKETQFLISTHSDVLLDYFESEKIIVIEKDENNSSIVNRFKKGAFDDGEKEMTPGELWKRGFLGGNRW